MASHTGVKKNNENYYTTGKKWVRWEIDETEQELRDMCRDEATYGLTEQQILFCEHYVRTHNIKASCKKAGFNIEKSHAIGWKVRQKYEARRYIAWLKLRITDEAVLEASQVVDMWKRIAFADITDYVTLDRNRVLLQPGQEIDGQLVKSVTSGRDGLKVELHSKENALKELMKYFEYMPKDERIKLEERKVELMEQRLELEKKKMGLGPNIVEDDGFFEALSSTAKQVWDGEDDED